MNLTVKLKPEEMVVELFQIGTYNIENDIKNCADVLLGRWAYYPSIFSRIKKIGHDSFYLNWDERTIIYKLAHGAIPKKYFISRLHPEHANKIIWLHKYGLGCYTDLKDGKIVTYDASLATTRKITITDDEKVLDKICGSVQYLTRNMFLVYDSLKGRNLFVNDKGVVIKTNDNDYNRYHPLVGDYFIYHSPGYFDIYRVVNNDIVIHQHIDDPDPINDDYYFAYDENNLLNVYVEHGNLYSIGFRDEKFYLQDPSEEILTPCNVHFIVFEDVYIELKNMLLVLNLPIVFLPIIFDYLKCDIDAYDGLI